MLAMIGLLFSFFVGLLVLYVGAIILINIFAWLVNTIMGDK